jgi:CRP-like cAMP-binding protein
VRRALLACLATTVVRWASLSKVSDDVGLLRKMIMSMTYVRIAAGEDVFCEGEIGETFYVIVTGVLSVNVEGSGVVKKMGAGESFGEMALLDRQNCTRWIDRRAGCAELRGAGASARRGAAVRERG